MNLTVEIIPIPGIPEIHKNDDLTTIIADAAASHQIVFQEKDILVVTQKIISKAEGCLIQKHEIQASEFAQQMSVFTGHSPENMELVLQSSRRIVRMTNGFIISQTKHGFVMANAGVDSSNTGGEDYISVLPVDPDASALKIKNNLEDRYGVQLTVIISDTFGRPWREGQINMAIGVAGMKPLVDYRGKLDDNGRIMKATCIAAADELCSAAELVSGKTSRFPAVIIRNYRYIPGPGSARELVMDEEHDVFK